MSFITLDIARIRYPFNVSLSRSFNPISFRSNTKGGEKVAFDITVKLTKNSQTVGQSFEHTRLVFQGADGKERVFGGVKSLIELQRYSGSFFIGEKESETAENIRRAILEDDYLRSRVDIVIPPTLLLTDWAQNGAMLQIRGKGSGEEFSLTLSAPGDAGSRYYSISKVETNADKNDSLIGNTPSAEISLDVYENPKSDLVTDFGDYLTTLRKTYIGEEVNFDLGRLFENFSGYKLPPNSYEWANTGTSKSYKISASVTTHTTMRFFFSSTLRVVNGRTLLNESGDLSAYVCRGNENYDPPTGTVKLLSNKPRCTYIKGQKEYLNFIFLDPRRGDNVDSDYSIGVRFRAFSPMGEMLRESILQTSERNSFSDVNTLLLDIDGFLSTAPSASLVEANLQVGENPISEAIGFDVRPDCWHKVQQVIFLNRLGGWDAFNFDAEVKEENKITIETYRKTRRIGFQKGDAIEDIHNSSLRTSFFIESAPIDSETAEWLKELAVSPVVLDNEGRRIIVEEITLNVDPSNIDMHRFSIKYHESV